MNPDVLRKHIAAAPFLSGLSRRQVEVIAECACHTQFDAGDVIFRQGETANRFYLLENGSVQLEAALKSGERRVLAGRIESGGVLGWSWLFEPYQWQFTARALTATTAIFFYGTVLREHCEADPSLGFELFKRMSAEMVRRLQAARNRLLEAHSGFSEVAEEAGAQAGRLPAMTPSSLRTYGPVL
ncbi:MAG TPA: cyclic nucleotide-binding domain-containing protein [Chthoniobacterales bacterium]|nr:cyclic nucleotide-binding domain-containing protein [Chthoniobacterales bacterium]